VQAGNFHFEYLPGFRLGQTRVTPDLPKRLWQGRYDAYIKCINGRMALPVTYAIARLKRKPFILWTGIWERLQTPAHRLFFPLTRYIYQHADAIVVYGEHVKRYLISEGVPGERIFVAAHAVDNPAYNRAVSDEELAALRHQLKIGHQQKVVLYLGRLEEGKGLNFLLDAFEALCQQDDVVLVLAGAGSEATNLQQLVHDKGINENVRFAGYVSSHQTIEYYALACVYVLPSITTATFKEPWGLVVNEAMNQGTPVIATDAVGAAAGGLVQDSINGFIVPERNSAALAQALQRILEDPMMSEGMSQQARAIIAAWDNEQMVMGFRQAIDFVTDKSR
jgi:glycosyltransferase involved in cell wall biosynthesis